MDNSLSTRTPALIRFRWRLIVLVAIAAALLPPSAVQAQTWTNGNGTGNWDENGNWSAAPYPDAAGATATFGAAVPPGNATITINADPNIIIGSIVINNPTTSLITGQTFTYNNGAANSQIQFNMGNWTIATPGTIGGNGTLSVSTAGNGTLSGALTGGNATVLQKSGIGMLTLSADNSTFTGMTNVIGGGTLRLAVSNALGGTSAVNVSGASTLQSDVTGTINNSAAVTVLDTSMFNIGTSAFETIGSLSGNGNVNLANGSTLAISAGGGNFSGVIAGTGNVQKNSGGTQILSGANTFSGTTIVNGGSTLALNGAGALGGTSSVTITGAGSTLMLGANNAINNTAPVNVNSAGAVFDVNGFSDTIGGLSGAAGSSATLGNGALTVDGGGTFNGVISGAGGSLTKSGAATLTLNGNDTYTGPTTVNAGRLDVNGNGSSAVTVNNAATFGGTGSVPSVTANNGSTVAPGNSIGTLTVTGAGTPAYTQMAGSVYQAEVNNLGTVPGVNNDLISLTNPAATASLAGTVNLIDTTAGGFYDAGMTYTILTTANPAGVTGTYTGITPMGFAANRTAVLMHNPNNVQVQVQRLAGNFAMNSKTRNQKSVGGALDGVNALQTGPLGMVLDQLVLLPNAQKAKALDQLSGEIHASLVASQVQTTSRFIDMVSRRMRTNTSSGSGIYGATVPPVGGMYMGSNDSGVSQRVSLTDGGDFVVRAQGVGLPTYGGGFGGMSPCSSGCGILGGAWASGFGVGGDVDGDNNGNPFDYTLAGTAFGVEQNLSPMLLMGLVGGYSHNDVDMKRLRSSAEVDAYHAGIYAHLNEGMGYTTAVATVGYQEYNTRRRVVIPGPVVLGNAFGDYDGHEFATYIEKGVNLSFGALLVQPLVGLQYINIQRDSFTETGTPGVTLSAIEDHVDSLRLSLGGRLAPEIPLGYFGAVTPELRGRWVHEFLDDSQVLGASVSGAPGTNFIVNSADLGRNFGVIGAGLNAQISPMARVYIDYDFTFSSSLQSHAGSGGIEFLW